MSIPSIFEEEQLDFLRDLRAVSTSTKEPEEERYTPEAGTRMNPIRAPAW